MTGDRKKVSVVYSLIFFVYSSSIGWVARRPGLAVASAAPPAGADCPAPAWVAGTAKRTIWHAARRTHTRSGLAGFRLCTHTSLLLGPGSQGGRQLDRFRNGERHLVLGQRRAEHRRLGNNCVRLGEGLWCHGLRLV